MGVSIQVWAGIRGDAECDRVVFDPISERVGNCVGNGHSVCRFDGLSMGPGTGDELGGGGSRSCLRAAAAERMV